MLAVEKYIVEQKIQRYMVSNEISNAEEMIIEGMEKILNKITRSTLPSNEGDVFLDKEVKKGDH